jgi:hypothetical protein
MTPGNGPGQPAARRRAALRRQPEEADLVGAVGPRHLGVDPQFVAHPDPLRVAPRGKQPARRAAHQQRRIERQVLDVFQVEGEL